jgi:butyrate kinase
MSNFKIFTINPGSTSTKIALFENETCVFSSSVTHDTEILNTFSEVRDQFPYRKETILKKLEKERIRLDNIAAFAGRGGGLVSLVGGTYLVNEVMLSHARAGFTVKHPASLGCQLAHDFALQYGVKAFVVNPPDVDEFDDVARVTGLKGVYRESRVHALNQKEIAIRFAASQKKRPEDINVIIAHVGGGISVTAHRKGLMVDSNDIAQGDGPMAPTRCGALPVRDVIRMCFSGGFTEKEMYDKMTKTGGLVDHLNTSDALEVKSRIQKGDRYAELIYNAMIYQIGKSVGACAATLLGDVQGIVLTGGISNDTYLTNKITEMTKFIAPVTVMAGEFEMEALAAGVLRVLTRLEEPKTYTGSPVWNGFSFSD